MHMYCTDCLSTTKKYYYIKVLYVRKKRKFVPSGIFQCENCLTVLIPGEVYKKLRSSGKHIIQVLEHKLEYEV